MGQNPQEERQPCWRTLGGLHEWGAANSVTFEASKESFHILSHTQAYGESFRLLGVTFDVQLYMGEAVHECTVEAHWRLSALLRSR